MGSPGSHTVAARVLFLEGGPDDALRERLEREFQPDRVITDSSMDRDDEFRDRWMDALSHLIEAFHADDRGRWRRRGIPLFEVARYGVFFALAPAVSRLRALARLRSETPSAKVIWWTRPDRPLDWPQYHVLTHCSAGPQGGIHFLSPPSRTRAAMLGLRADVGAARQRVSLAVGAMLRAQPAPPSRRPSVVFTEFFPNSTRAAVPVAASLQQDGVPVVWLPARESVATRLRQLGATSVLSTDYLEAPSILRRGGLSSTEHAHLRFDLSRACRAVNDAVPPELPRLSGAIRTAFAEAALWVARYDIALSRLRPDTIVSTTYSSIPGRAAAMVAQARGVNAVYLQHGLFPDRKHWGCFCHDVKLMWGQYERRALARAGDSAGVAVVGSPLYDGLAARVQLPADERPTPKRPPRLVFMASRSGGTLLSLDEARASLIAVAEAARAIRTAKLLVKAHPGDDTDLPERVLAAYPEVELVRNGLSQDLILESDVVILVSSTTGLEACIAGRPLIVLSLAGATDQTEFTHYGAALAARPHELANTIRGILEEPATRASLAKGRRRLLDDRLAGADGLATERAARAILDCSTLNTAVAP